MNKKKSLYKITCLFVNYVSNDIADSPVFQAINSDELSSFADALRNEDKWYEIKPNVWINLHLIKQIVIEKHEA